MELKIGQTHEPWLQETFFDDPFGTSNAFNAGGDFPDFPPPSVGDAEATGGARWGVERGADYMG